MIETTPPPSYIDKYVITGLITNAVLTGLVFLLFGANPFTLVVAGWVSLSFVGAVALAALQPIIGANLLIIGSIPLVPVGMIGILAGLRIRGRVNKRPVPETAGPIMEQFQAVGGPRQVIVPVVLLTIGLVLPGPILAAGVTVLILAFLQKNDTVVTLYNDFIEVRKSPMSGKLFGFSPSEVTHTGLFRKGKELGIRYRAPNGQEETAKLFSGWIGEENFNKVASLVNRAQPAEEAEVSDAAPSDASG